MTSEEKDKHEWSCDMSRGDQQCPYWTAQGAESYLRCTWKVGHPESLPHEIVHNQPTPPPQRIWSLRD